MNINQQQAIAHLEALGYAQSTPIYLRCFPKNKGRARNFQGTIAQLPWDDLHRLQAQDYGVYVVVNGQGHKDVDVVCKHWKTLDRWRVGPDSTLLDGIHWQHDGGEVVYHADLLKDWDRHRGDPIAHQRTITHFLATLPSNQAKKRGRKAS